MDWFFEKRGKSVASNAQRIVADMHKHLDLQTKKAKEMEDIMLKVVYLAGALHAHHSTHLYIVRYYTTPTTDSLNQYILLHEKIANFCCVYFLSLSS